MEQSSAYYHDRDPTVLTYEKMLKTMLDFNKQFRDIPDAWHLHPKTLKILKSWIDKNPDIKKLNELNNPYSSLPFTVEPLAGLKLIEDEIVPQGWRYEYRGTTLLKIVDMRK